MSSILPSAVDLSTPRGPNFFLKGRIFRIIFIFRFFFCVQVIQVAEELIKTVCRRQEFIFIAQVILPELTSSISQGFRNSAMVGSSFCNPTSAPGKPTLVNPVRKATLAGNKCRPACGAALLAIIIRKHGSFRGDTVDVRRFKSHHAAVPAAEVPEPDIITEYDEDIWFSAADASWTRASLKTGLHQKVAG